MRRMALSVLGLCVFGFFSLLMPNSASAGEYYGGHAGYSGGNVWYSSSCCYRKVVKHVRKVRYVRVDDGYRHGYYAPPRYQSYYDGGPYRSTVYSEPYRGPYYTGRPYRYFGGEYAGGVSGYRVGYGVSYGGYVGGYAPAYADRCTVRRARVYDGYGGWVWTRSRVCY